MTSECRCFGPVHSNNVQELANVLRGLCFKYSDIQIHEVVLKVPLQSGTTSTPIKLSRRLNKDSKQQTQRNPFQDKLPERWLVQHEGLPLKGAAVADLPATVCEVVESYCYTNTGPEFWQSLGAKFDYELVKRGNEYLCYHQGYEVKVLLFQALALLQQGDVNNLKSMGRYVIDIRARVPEGKHVEGAKALGAFGAKLHPLVALQKAEIPVT